MLALTGVLVLTLQSAEALPELSQYVARPAGIMTDQRLVEFSGMAPSRRVDRRFWAINDGGQAASLWQIDARGRIKREVPINGITNVDFEDITSFVYKKKAYLAIGEIGDNAAATNLHKIYVIAEPSAKAKTADVAWVVTYKYPDRAHDAESLMADVKNDRFYIVNKRVEPPAMFSLPLKPSQSSTVIADDVGLMANIPRPVTNGGVIDPKSVNQITYASQPTSAVLDCSGDRIYLLTYAAVYRYHKRADQHWKDALIGQQPLRIQLPPIYQAEAITLSTDCSTLFVGSEKVPSVLWKYEIQALKTKSP